MPARFFIDAPLFSGANLSLPPGPARHVQVLRLQPGATIALFDGRGGEFAATVTQMGRSEVQVLIGAHDPVQRELARSVTLALGMPANERMDTLIEKAAELGVAAIAPLMCERSVLRLHGERAEKKLAHWRGVAIAASEQCGRTQVPALAAIAALSTWLAALPPLGVGASTGARWLLSLQPGAPTLAQAAAALADARTPVRVLSGPEGGLSAGEEALALRCGFAPVGLGPRVLRADTAPLAVLALLGLVSP